MRRINLFLIVTVISLASLVSVTVAGYFILSAQTNPYSSDWMGQMMGGMMGGYTGTAAQAQSSAAPYLSTAFIVLVAVAVVGIGGLVYFIAFPEIRMARAGTRPVMAAGVSPAASTPAAAENSATAYDTVVKTLTDKERKVIGVLNNHNGKYLQKYIRNEAGLSRLQTHRIVARLAERDIVSLEKTGNTNMVKLADWLK